MEPKHQNILAITLWRIETSAAEALDLDAMAAACGISGPHLVRAFREAFGTTPVAYLRARRLSEAARALMNGAPDILDLALGAGYGSHEAFSRAFHSRFGMSPSAARDPDGAHQLVPKLMEPFMMETASLPTLPAPDLRARDEMNLIGIADRIDHSAIPRIPAIWSAFNPRISEIDAGPEPAAYGACYDNDETGFRYMAGVPATPGARVPVGMERLVVPGGRYAVWIHDGPVGDMHRTMRAIFESALPAAGLTTRDAPELERYDASFDATSGSGPVEIWIPVA